MRKINVFGKSNKTSKPLYVLATVFIFMVIGYVVLLIVSTARLSALETENSQIQQNINVLLLSEHSQTYSSVEELIPYLPDEFRQSNVYNELVLARDLSSLQLAANFSIDFMSDTENPFEENINGSLNYVKINITFTTDDTSKALDYINNIISLDRLYYIDSTSLDILSVSNTMVEISLYTFYIS